MQLEGFLHRLVNCVVELSGDTTLGVTIGSHLAGTGGYAGNNLILNGKIGLLGFGSMYVENNTFYNNLNCVNVQSTTGLPLLYACNNIFMPKLSTGHGLTIDVVDASAAAGSAQNDYNCFWSVDGQQLDTPFYNGFPGGATPVLGAHSMQVDPMFTSDYRVRNAEVLRGGKPDIHGNAGQIGAVLRKHFQRRSVAGRSTSKRFFR
jgi:hypothetical protein